VKQQTTNDISQQTQWTFDWERNTRSKPFLPLDNPYGVQKSSCMFNLGYLENFFKLIFLVCGLWFVYLDDILYYKFGSTIWALFSSLDAFSTSYFNFLAKLVISCKFHVMESPYSTNLEWALENKFIFVEVIDKRDNFCFTF